MQESTNIKPKNISLAVSYRNSVFGNCECETIMRNIIMLQKKADPDNWTPFTWEQYKDFCTHKVTTDEKGVLDAFVNGGKPVWKTTAYLQPGWLQYEDGKYSFTDKMIEMLFENYPETHD